MTAELPPIDVFTGADVLDDPEPAALAPADEYLTRKGIALQALQDACNATVEVRRERIWSDTGYREGKILFRELLDAEGSHGGYERILGEKISKDCKLQDKRAANGSKVSKTFTPVGFDVRDLGSITDRIIVCGSFADGYWLNEATGEPVAAGAGEANIPGIADAIDDRNKGKAEILVAVDNDDAGHRAGEKSARPWACPDSVKDWSDLCEAEGLDAVKEQVNRITPPEKDEPRETALWSSPVCGRGLTTTKPSGIPWFADQRIQLGRGMLLTGIGGSSKTRVMYQLAIGAVIGRLAWSWEVTTTGRALLVLTEDTFEDYHRTVYGCCEALHLTADELQAVDDKIIAYPMAGQDVRLLAKLDRHTLVKSPEFQALQAKAEEYGDVCFIGLDPALSLTEGDEMEQNDQRQLGKMADDLAVRTGASVCLVAHATKASSNAEELGSHNSRGGGAITDAVRMEYGMRTMTAKEASKAGIDDTEERKRHKQLVATKGNHIPPAAFVPVWLRAGEGGVLYGVDLDFDAAPSAGKAGQGKRQKEALSILEKMHAEHRLNVVKNSRDEAEAKVSVKEWREAMQEGGIPRQRTYDLPKTLEQAGLVEIEGWHVWPT